MINKRMILVSISFLIFISCDKNIGDDPGVDPAPPRFVGARSSYYGFDSFPSPEAFGTVITNLAADIEGGIPSSAWIIGGIQGTECDLEFPAPDTITKAHITFHDSDKHEVYLTEFDRIGAQVFLQVEAGMANMDTLITLVLNQYSHHPSVAGFGIDVEWFPSEGETNGPGGAVDVKLDTTDLRRWDNLVKSYNSRYRIFVKHWVPSYCGEGPISDVIYIDDSQGVPTLDDLVGDFAYWAKQFVPNDVGFQIGYPNDKPWWSTLPNPLKDITDAIDTEIKEQKVHIYWVDFTLEDSEMSDYWIAKP